jgi:Family of unknown function (DUF6064)
VDRSGALHAVGIELVSLKARHRTGERRFMEMRMNMPFTAAQFFDVFARYNMTVWPVQIALNALAVLALVLVYRARPSAGRWIAAILAALWAWMAIAYHFACFAAINPAACAFGALSLLGALWLAWVCAVKWRRFPVGANPTRRTLQPEATGAGMEVTKCLKRASSEGWLDQQEVDLPGQ